MEITLLRLVEILIMNKKNIRNFSIIAHIDHGKSTLADRIIETSKAVAQRDMKSQILDSMDLERERGITIKLNAVQLHYNKDNIEYEFNLIDTPGHVDFAYEVSRSLAASDAAILLVDATQGVQPQTIANTYLALENDLEILPVINKVDMEAADVMKTKIEIEEILGIDTTDAPEISAKTGEGLDKVFDMIINRMPSPTEPENDTDLKALLFDSYFDAYRGIVMFVRIDKGTIKKGDKLKFVQNEVEFDVIEVGVNTPKQKQLDMLEAGQVG
jgi:GTP-binding protein LepA